MMWKIFLDPHSCLEHVLPKKITSFLYLTASFNLQKKKEKKKEKKKKKNKKKKKKKKKEKKKVILIYNINY